MNTITKIPAKYFIGGYCGTWLTTYTILCYKRDKEFANQAVNLFNSGGITFQDNMTLSQRHNLIQSLKFDAFSSIGSSLLRGFVLIPMSPFILFNMI